MMGPDWIPSGLVTRAIAEMMTKGNDAYEQAQMEHDPYAEESAPMHMSVPISLHARPRHQRPKSAMQASRPNPLEGSFQEPISLQQPLRQRPKSAMQASRTPMQQSIDSIPPHMQRPSPVGRQRPKSAMQVSRTKTDFRKPTEWNPYQMENRATWKEASRYPPLPLRVEGMGCIATHIREGNGRVLWNEVPGFGRKGQGRVHVRPSSAPTVRRCESSPLLWD